MRIAQAMLCVSILVSACGSSSLKDSDAMKNPDNDAISMAATFTVTETNLEIDYSIVNRGAHPVFLLDTTVIIDPHGAATAGPARPRIEYLPPGTVVISDKLFPIPRGTRMAVPPSAYGERLDPRASKHSRLILPLPLKDHASRTSKSSREVMCHKIRFVVGAVPDSPDLHAEEQTIAGVPLWRLGPAAWSGQREAATEHALASPVRVVVAN